MPSFAEALAGAERWLLPPACLLCEAPVPAAKATRWSASSAAVAGSGVGPLCARCGQPAFGDLECRLCAAWPGDSSGCGAPSGCAVSAREAVHRLKYEGWWRVAETLAEAMRGLEPLTGQVCLIPVPLGARRLRSRGYNQSERIAAALGGGPDFRS